MSENVVNPWNIEVDQVLTKESLLLFILLKMEMNINLCLNSGKHIQHKSL